MAELTTLKRSKQRDAIVAFLKTRKDHPTADMVYHEIRQTIPNISLGTVYRNLSLLSDRGEILRLSCDGKTDRFDADIRPHYHFICNVAVYRMLISLIRKILITLPTTLSPARSLHTNCYFKVSAILVDPTTHINHKAPVNKKV